MDAERFDIITRALISGARRQAPDRPPCHVRRIGARFTRRMSASGCRRAHGRRSGRSAAGRTTSAPPTKSAACRRTSRAAVPPRTGAAAARRPKARSATLTMTPPNPDRSAAPARAASGAWTNAASRGTSVILSPSAAFPASRSPLLLGGTAPYTPESAVGKSVSPLVIPTP
jgi:hypothetical protein